MFETSKINLKRVFLAFLALAVIMPFLTFAGSSKKLYVDYRASGTQNGSSSHPYKTITQALKKADKNTKVFVSDGTYRENLVVPKSVEILGEGRDKTFIKAKSDDDSAVYLNGGAQLYKLTIKDGKNGVKVADGGRVKIIKCRIEDNDRDGVIIYSGKLNDSNKVTISETDIRDNGRNGIFSEKRNLVIYESDIDKNGSDGASFAAGTKAWIEGTNFRENSGSGLKVKLDGSEIYTKNNAYYNNDREGVEVNANGAAGRVDLKQSRFINNANYGVSRVQRAVFSENIWKGLTVEGAIFSETEKGEISRIFKILN
jgi:hypothetical protein